MSNVMTSAFILNVLRNHHSKAAFLLEMVLSDEDWMDPWKQGRVTVKRKSVIQPHPEPLPNQIIQSLAYRASKVSKYA